MAAGVTFPTPMTPIPGFLESGAHFMESTPEATGYGFDFNNFRSMDVHHLKFNDLSATRNGFENESDLIIPTFVDTLKPVISSN